LHYAPMTHTVIALSPAENYYTRIITLYPDKSIVVQNCIFV